MDALPQHTLPPYIHTHCNLKIFLPLLTITRLKKLLIFTNVRTPKLFNLPYNKVEESDGIQW